jgi:hypothetical protein
VRQACVSIGTDGAFFSALHRLTTNARAAASRTQAHAAMGALCGRPHAAEDDEQRRSSSSKGGGAKKVMRRATHAGATVTATAVPPAAAAADAAAAAPTQTVTEPAPVEFAHAAHAAHDDADAAAASAGGGAARPVTPSRVDEPLTEEEVGEAEEAAVSGGRRAPRARTPESHPLSPDEKKPKGGGASSSEEEEEEREEAPAHGGARFYELRPTVENPSGVAASVRRTARERGFLRCELFFLGWAPPAVLLACALASALTRRDATARIRVRACVRVCAQEERVEVEPVRASARSGGGDVINASGHLATSAPVPVLSAAAPTPQPVEAPPVAPPPPAPARDEAPRATQTQMHTQMPQQGGGVAEVAHALDEGLLPSLAAGQAHAAAARRAAQAGVPREFLLRGAPLVDESCTATQRSDTSTTAPSVASSYGAGGMGVSGDEEVRMLRRGADAARASVEDAAAPPQQQCGGEDMPFSPVRPTYHASSARYSTRHLTARARASPQPPTPAVSAEELGLESCEEFPEKPKLEPGTKGEVGTADHRFAQRTPSGGGAGIGERTPARGGGAAGGGAPTPVKPRLLFGRPSSHAQARLLCCVVVCAHHSGKVLSACLRARRRRTAPLRWTRRRT